MGFQRISSAIIGGVFVSLILALQLHSQEYTGVIGDKIELRTGSLSLTREDATVFGRRGSDFTLTRTYQSEHYVNPEPNKQTKLGITYVVSGSQKEKNKYFGEGWSWEIPYLFYSDSTAGSPHVSIRYSDGSEESIFMNNDALTKDTLPLKTRKHALMTSNLFGRDSLAGDTMVLGNTSNTDEMLLVDGTKWIFSHFYTRGTGCLSRRKGLTKIISPYGDTTFVVYHGSTGWVQSITTQSGLWVKLHYSTLSDSIAFNTAPSTTDTTVRLSAISFPRYYSDSSYSTLKVTYAYSGGAKRLLSSVTFPTGLSECYAYTQQRKGQHEVDYDSDTSNYSSDSNFEGGPTEVTLLSQVTTLGGATVSYTYRESYLPLCGDQAFAGDCGVCSPFYNAGAVPPGEDATQWVHRVFDTSGFKGYLSVIARVAGTDTTRFRFRTTESVLLWQFVQPSVVASKTTVVHQDSAKDEYFYFMEMKCPANLHSNLGGLGSSVGSIPWPSNLFHEQHIASGDTTCVGYSYASFGDSYGGIYERTDTLGVFYDSTYTGSYWEYSTSIPIIAKPSTTVRHNGVRYFNPIAHLLGDTLIFRPTGEKRLSGSYSRQNQRLQDLTVRRVEMTRKAQTTHCYSQTQESDYAAFIEPFNCDTSMYYSFTDQVPYQIDSILEYLYVAKFNRILITKTMSTTRRDTTAYTTYHGYEYDTTKAYASLTKSKIWYGTEFGITDTLISIFRFDANGMMYREINPTNDSTDYVYDGEYRKVRTIVWGLDTTMTESYFPDGNLAYRVGANADTIRIAQDHLGRDSLTINTLETGFSTRTVYANKSRADSTKLTSGMYIYTETIQDDYLRPVRTSTRQPDGSFVIDSTIYNAISQPDSTMRARLSTDTTSRIWTCYFYDQSNRLVKTVYPDGSWDTTLYIDEYTIESLKSTGSRIRTESNIHGDVIRLISYDTSGSVYDTIQNFYDRKGQLIKVTDHAGRSRLYEYDKYGRRAIVTDPDAGSIRTWFTRDGKSRFVRHNTESSYLYFKYDRVGRLIEEGFLTSIDSTKVDDTIYPSTGRIEPNTFKYDGYSSGNWTDTANGLNGYQGRKTEIYDQSGSTRFYYDKRGRIGLKIVSITGLATKRTKYEYFANDAIKRITYPDSTFTDYTYDVAGRINSISQVVDSGKITYEPWEAIKSIDFKNGLRSRRSYDNMSRLAKSLNWRGSTNHFNRGYIFTKGMLSIETNLDTLGGSVVSTYGFPRSYNYDSIGRLIQDSIVDQDHVVSERSSVYGYDKSHNLDSMKVIGLSTLRYTRFNGHGQDSVIRFGREVSGAFVGDSCWAFAKDARGRITQIIKYNGANPTGTWVNKRTFGYNVRSQMTSLSFEYYGAASGDGPDVVANLYDYAGQKVRQTFTYQVYEPIDTSHFPGGGGEEFMSGGDSTELEEMYYSGTDTTGGESSFSSGGGGGSWHWATYTKTHYYVWSNKAVIWEQETGLGEFKHVYGLGARLATMKVSGGADSVNVYVYDYLGNVRALLRANGTSVETSTEYYSYGGVYKRVGSGGSRFGYISKEEDDYTKLVDFGPRYYEPSIGKFLAPDPILSSASAYTYTPGNPIMMADPTGLMSPNIQMAQEREDMRRTAGYYNQHEIATMAQWDAFMDAAVVDAAIQKHEAFETFVQIAEAAVNSTKAMAKALKDGYTFTKVGSNFLFGNGRDLHLNISEIDTRSIALANSRQFMDFVGTLEPGQYKLNKQRFVYHFTTRLEADILGDAHILLTGDLNVSKGNKWKFRGRLGVDADFFNFNASTHRSPEAEERVRFIRENVEGKTFTVPIQPPVVVIPTDFWLYIDGAVWINQSGGF